jgi:hypothetical protein
VASEQGEYREAEGEVREVSVTRKKLNMTFTDRQQNTSNLSHYIDDAAEEEEVETFVAAARLVSAAGLERYLFATAVNEPEFNPLGVGEDYPDVEDKAVFLFRAADGSVVRVQIPAPLESDLQADNETINELNPNVSAFIAECLLLIVTTGGRALEEYLRGYRDRAKTRKIKPGLPA